MYFISYLAKPGSSSLPDSAWDHQRDLQADPLQDRQQEGPFNPAFIDRGVHLLEPQHHRELRECGRDLQGSVVEEEYHPGV